MKNKVFYSICIVIAVSLVLVFAFMPLRPVIIKGNLIFAQTAKTPQQRAKGLQKRLSMPDNHGMLFIFEAETKPNFWMKDTFISLSIAFIDKNKNIVDIMEMEPRREDKIYSPAKNSKYALEMNSGWFKKNNIKTGNRVWFY